MKSIIRAIGLACGLAALWGGDSRAQGIGSEQSTVLTAFVTEEATISLESRASRLAFGGARGSVSLISHRAAELSRSLRIFWRTDSGDSGGQPTSLDRVLLPLAGRVLSPAPEFPDSAVVRVKVESFEF